MTTNNTYFAELDQIARAFDEKRRAHEAKKQQILDTYGWDSEELNAWYREKEEMAYPISEGACKAFRAFRMSEERNSSEFEMEDFLWEREVADFINALRQAGIKTFAYTNQSTAVMENIHAFVAVGCTMDGLCTVTRQERRWGEDETTEHIGIRFTV
ncbi:MAG: hypothetical protein IJV41_02515 [Oscillospiraceae bacterium]|nr:hypothetical protein [Parasporobacterium sp.]MBQ9685408.1 hypothetical protein [Oscillospiraceae bacterium]